mgnify:CR=1 FL=1
MEILKGYPQDMTVEQLMETLSSGVRSESAAVESVPTPPVKEKKKRKKRTPSAFHLFMKTFRPKGKEHMRQFMEDNPTVDPSVVVALLTDVFDGATTDGFSSSPVSDAQAKLKSLKRDKKLSFADWCTANELVADDYEGEGFKGRKVMCLITKLGGQCWRKVEDKTPFEEEAAELKAAAADKE